MTTFERFERDIPELMTELAPARVPDYFDDMLRQTAGHRQRPAWAYLERWLPMGVIARPVPIRPMSLRPILVLALIGALIAAGLALYVGSRQTRLPPPFGAAGNGVLLVKTADGSISSIDPRTGALATIAPASEALGEPIPSRDGQRVAFIPRSPVAAPIIVAGVDGSDRATLAGEYRDVQNVDWSPDGSHIAFVADDRGIATITIAATDGSAARTLPLARNVWRLRYLPDGRLAVIAADEPGQVCPGEDATTAPCALFVVNPDGTGLDRLVAAQDFHGLGLDPSPDGTKLVYVEWTQPDEPGRLHVVDLRDGSDRLLPVEGFPAEYSINRASFSPNGSWILFDFFEVEGEHWAIIPASGGAPVRIGPKWPRNPSDDALWAPDGTSVLVRYPTGDATSQLWVIDATGSGTDMRLEVDVPSVPAWQRVGT